VDRRENLVKLQTVLVVLVLLLTGKSLAQQVFDSHVHLWEGEKSLREYEAQARTAGIDLVGIGGMWFGGPNLALSGHPGDIRASNDAHFALAKKHPEMLPIATVHPYDGEAAIGEVSRVAALGFKVLKLHPHTQKFDPSDPRVLAIVTRAGDLGHDRADG
jgi:predicted TIM-barrel fold metal-dependent hydrolase